MTERRSMITLDDLKKIAVKQQTTVLNTQREYLQHLFLTYFYRQNESEKILFKGGTALRIVYNSPRFSEDLDFSSNADIKTIEKVVENTLIEIEREGIKADIVESKKTSGGYLAIIKFILIEQILSVQIEISLRTEKPRGEIETVVNDFVPPYTLMALKKESLIEEKLQALLDRQKPRDFYDLYYILRANLLPPREKKILPKVLEILKKTKILFDQELEIFLPKTHMAVVKDFKAILEREIRKYV